ncbi:ABC transporter permease [Microbacterium sp. zg.B48]|uniref:ABC transporter permease n=1 Tax=unclassified Microbacterium TaxID=2609290 RepID=UPI00214CA9E7|nr:MULTISPECIES: ABC transporter permease [unclassified Microbacterium]MCR2763549.1 ABC transporter permease [Microbacterium sp. zg.B48]MCR2809271.1 ABC transporter permease [Microbacterium sp. zg.B185]WIM20414.1 ABC transporter permease [Microbacterium sp. zg-B185]
MAVLTQTPTPARARRRSTPGAGSAKRKSIIRGAIGLVVLFVVAELISRSGIVDSAFLPPTSLVLVRTAELLVDPGFIGAVLATLQAWGIGLLICIVVAVSIGVVLGSSRGAYSASRAVIEFLRPIPSVALIPLAILVFGNDAEMKIALIVFSTLWPVLFNTIYGMHDVDPIAKLTAQSFGRGRVATLFSVSLPSAAPFIFTGIRIAASVALIVAVSAELLAGASDGLGRWMLDAGATGNRPDLVYAATIIAGLLGLAINGVLVLIERRFLSWQPALRQTGKGSE